MENKNGISCTSCNTRYLVNKQKKINKEKIKDYKECQSCGLSLFKTPNKEHTYYCNDCWKEGEFTNKNISIDDMKVNNYLTHQKYGYSKKEIKSLNRKLKKLVRWINN